GDGCVRQSSAGRAREFLSQVGYGIANKGGQRFPRESGAYLEARLQARRAGLEGRGERHRCHGRVRSPDRPSGADSEAGFSTSGDQQIVRLRYPSREDNIRLEARILGVEAAWEVLSDAQPAPEDLD